MAKDDHTGLIMKFQAGKIRIAQLLGPFILSIMPFGTKIIDVDSSAVIVLDFERFQDFSIERKIKGWYVFEFEARIVCRLADFDASDSEEYKFKLSMFMVSSMHKNADGNRSERCAMKISEVEGSSLCFSSELLRS